MNILINISTTQCTIYLGRYKEYVLTCLINSFYLYYTQRHIQGGGAIRAQPPRKEKIVNS